MRQKNVTLISIWCMIRKMTQIFIFWFVFYWLGVRLFFNRFILLFYQINFLYQLNIPLQFNFYIIYIVQFKNEIYFDNICHISIYFLDAQSFNFICLCLHQRSTITKPYMFWLDMRVMQIPRKIFYLLCLLCSVWWD